MQVVDVVEIRAVDLRDARIDVARHGEVDEKERAHFARGQRAFDVVGSDQMMRRSGRSDDDVAFIELLFESVEMHSAAVEALRQLLGTIEGLVREVQPDLERRLLDKAGAAIVRAADTREVRLGLGSILK